MMNGRRIFKYLVRAVAVVLGVFTALVVIAAILQAVDPSALVSSSPAPAVVPATATVAPVPTQAPAIAPPPPTSRPAVAAPTAAPLTHRAVPVLGGPMSDFTAALGPPMPNTVSQVPGWKPCPNGTTAGLMVTLDNSKHVFVVDGQHCGDVEIPVDVRAVQAHAFLPPDAVRIGTAPSTTHEPSPVYMSKALAAAIDAGLFLDCDGNRVAPGTFVFDNNTDGAGDWALAVGRCAA